MPENPPDCPDVPTTSGLSIVVPAYASAATLLPLVERLAQVIPTLGSPCELILVDDGSPDDTWTVIEQLVAQYPWIRGRSMIRNFGQHNALLAGIRLARYDRIVTMDDDLQHPPEEIPLLLEQLTADVDVVYGVPAQEAHGLLRNIASIVTKFALQNAIGAKNARNISAFRIFRTQLRSAFDGYNHPFVNIDVLLTWGTVRYSSVTVQRDARTVGKSAYSFRKLVQHTMNMMTGFSVLPLQVSSLVGFCFTLFGFGLLVFVVGRYLIVGTDVPGFPFLASIIAIFSGAQLFALGVIGEYLARMHFRSMSKPAYTIKKAAESDSQ